jgi:hypothetical protein
VSLPEGPIRPTQGKCFVDGHNLYKGGLFGEFLGGMMLWASVLQWILGFEVDFEEQIVPGVGGRGGRLDLLQ